MAPITKPVSLLALYPQVLGLWRNAATFPHISLLRDSLPGGLRTGKQTGATLISMTPEAPWRQLGSNAREWGWVPDIAALSMCSQTKGSISTS